MASTDLPPPELWAHFRALYGQLHEQSSTLSDELAAAKRRNERAAAALSEFGVSSEQFEAFIATGVLGAGGRARAAVSTRKEFAQVRAETADLAHSFHGDAEPLLRRCQLAHQRAAKQSQIRSRVRLLGWAHYSSSP